MAKKAESKSNKEVSKKGKKKTKIKLADSPKVEKEKKKGKNKKNKSFFTDLMENVEFGAKLVGEKTSVLATETYEKVKKGAIEAIDTSSQVVGELYYSASEYTEQFKDKVEIKKLDAQKEKSFAELGRMFYKKYKIEGVAFSKFSRTKGFRTILNNIEDLDEEIVELGEHFKK